MMEEIISRRQHFNYRILDILKREYPQFSNSYLNIETMIGKYPHQRFGQIICNYVCPDYRDDQVSSSTTEFFNSIFPGNPDPFYEESILTFKRLTRL